MPVSLPSHSATPLPPPSPVPSPQWPAAVECLGFSDLPAELLARYTASAGQGTALCGLFPALRLAWASVDNTLFLWRIMPW